MNINTMLPNLTLNTVFLGNSIESYLYFILIFIGILIVFKIVQNIILLRLGRLAKKTKTEVDDKMIEIVRGLRPAFYFTLALWLSLQRLSINDVFHKVINILLVIAVVYQCIYVIQTIIDFLVSRKERDEGTQNAIGFITKIAKFIIWFLAFLLVLSNFGVNITSLLAGLGIGGIAIAMALQRVLGDLFSSITIYLDKPFQVGDFVLVNGEWGTIEKIGLKSTRIRSVRGEEIIMSNTELTSVKVNNFRKLESRRVDLKIGVVYGTPNTKLKKIPKIIKDALKSEKLAELDRSNFADFGESALLFETVYYIKSNEYKKYMDIKEKVNLKIKTEFEKEGIEMAFPTQTIVVSK